MMPLAKFWTFVGNWFVPLAAAWAVYVRNGLTDKPPQGAVVSRAYWGLIFTLIASAVLTWSFALYLKEAKRSAARLLAPPNTTFEEAGDRNAIISWGTVAFFAVCIVGAFILFGTSYSESVIHRWEARTGLADGFWASRKRGP